VAVANAAASTASDDGRVERRQQAGVVTAASAMVSEHGNGTASAALPGVLVDVPVAVLLIDAKDGTVTYANTAAVELAGNVRLPVDIDAGTGELLERLAAAPVDAGPRRLCDVAVSGRLDRRDDVALVAVRFC